MRTVCLIVAAGRGSRIGGDTPKQYRNLHGQPLLRRTVRAFLDHPEIDDVCVVIHPSDRSLFDQATQGLSLMEPCHGGRTRQESVFLGLQYLADQDVDAVLIHDAARPFIHPQTISDSIETLAGGETAILVALPVTDTIKRSSTGQYVGDTIDRKLLWRAQTPQGFRFQEILAAHQKAAKAVTEFTDDAAVAEWAGYKVALVTGSEDNFKVTNPEDIERAERLLRDREQASNAMIIDIRTGQGFDVHAFEEGDHVRLCGIDVPHSHKLKGHSDADVALHALTDAMLGAVAAGDIGSHFPPSDDRWKGADSEIFVREAAKIIADKGALVTNIDITIICERPKIGPHRDEMRMKVANMLGLSEERISVKATTTEKLGFTGRKEGIAAQAVVTVFFHNVPKAPEE